MVNMPGGVFYNKIYLSKSVLSAINNFTVTKIKKQREADNPGITFSQIVA